MSEFLKYIRSILGFGTSDEKVPRSRKRRLIQEEFDTYSFKVRRLNDYKMSQFNNDDWNDIAPSLKSNYLRHFPNRIQMTDNERAAMSSRPLVTDIIDISDDDDVIDISPFKSMQIGSIRSNGIKSIGTTINGSRINGSYSHSSKLSPNIVLAARQSLHNSSNFFNRSSIHSDTIRPEEQELYRDMLANSPRTSAAYSNSSPLTPHRDKTFDLQENSRSKKIMSLLKNKSNILMVDLTEEKSAGKLNKSNDSIHIKDSDSESDSTNRTNKKSPLNSMKKLLDNEPFMDPNFIKKLEDESTSKRNETKRLIQEERLKREKFGLVNRENVSIILESLAKTCKITDAIVLEVLEEKLTFPLFTTEQEAFINSALKCRNSGKLLNEKFNLRITAGDIKLLNEKEWLNDELINFYVNMIQERSTKNVKLPKVYAFSTFFYPKLVSSGYSSLRRWTKRVDIFSYDVIVVPVHLGFHWCMALIDFRDKSIRYYDSMLGVNMQCLSSLEKYLQEEYRDKKKAEFDTTGWQKVIMKDIPRQMNGSDCGVFSCTFAEFLTRNAKILFSQEHMPYIRRKMVLEIVQGKLLT